MASSSIISHYHVFLSFRGQDTRNTFIAHLHDGLRRKGIDVFIDDKLRRGQEISPALLQVIEGSRISIVVLSKDYASSTYCLDELVKILECRQKGQKVLPVFYNVDPSDVEKQKGSFGEALAGHEAQFIPASTKEKLPWWSVAIAKLTSFAGGHSYNNQNEAHMMGNMAKVRRWREALSEAASLGGWHLNNGNEAECIQSIVKEVMKLIPTSLHVAEHPVGLESRIQYLNSILDMESNGVIMVGIYGLGGIGKTTLAKAIYNRIFGEFEASCFLKSVTETINKSDVVHVQQDLLNEILEDKIEYLDNCARGINMIKQKFCNRRLLIVIDDVDSVNQLEKLAGARSWFGAGSRIIVTTRDKHVLDAHGIERKYKVKELSYEDAFVLFSWKAFKEPRPREDFLDLAHQMVEYADGLPLALEVLGSFLYGRNIHEWESEMNRLKRGPKKQIYDILKMSYDCLEHDDEKAIFLHIACLFKGMEINSVMRILQACDFEPVIGIRVLMDRSLVYIEHSKLQMHDLVQSMGMKVNEQESPKHGGRRLRFKKDILKELTENKGINEIEAINIDVPPSEKLDLEVEAFSKINGLRILMIRNAKATGCLENLPNLRWLELCGCSVSLSSGFHPGELVACVMQGSHIRQFGDSLKNCRNLKYMDFSFSEFLKETPDFSTTPNLVELKFIKCRNLVKIHPSIGYLDKLVILSFRDSCNFRSLSCSLSLRALELLDLGGCSKLETFPDVLGRMPKLYRLALDRSRIKELPSSVENLVGLRHLEMSECRNLTCIPSSIFMLPQLSRLYLESSPKLGKYLSGQTSLSTLYSQTNIICPISYLRLQDCKLTTIDFLVNSCWFDTMRHLDLSVNNFVSLPTQIRKFTKLGFLCLCNCKRLQEIPELPQSIKFFCACNCKSLQRYSELTSTFNKSKRFGIFDLSNSHLQAKNQGKALMKSLLSSMENKFGDEGCTQVILPAGNDIPEWFSYHSNSVGKMEEWLSFSMTDGLLSFKVPPHIFQQLIALAFCCICEPGYPCWLDIVINGQFDILISDVSNEEPMESDHAWLCYVPSCKFIKSQLLLRNEEADFQITVGNGPRRCVYMKSFAVFLICKQDEKANGVSVFKCISHPHSSHDEYQGKKRKIGISLDEKGSMVKMRKWRAALYEAEGLEMLHLNDGMRLNYSKNCQ